MLNSALLAYASLTGQQLFYPASLVAHRRAPELHGSYTATDALDRLLAGTGIRARRVGAKVIVLTREDEHPLGGADRSPGDGPENGSMPPLALAPAPTAADAVADRALATPDGPLSTSDIIVTGTHIRGAGNGASPVASISRDDIDRSGYATVAQALAAMPANFGGMATEQSALTFADSTGNNTAYGTGVNLRGLGADATLVLVNGRRIAGSGAAGDFSDISGIPTAAVDRVEMLLDGASALYGSDAVGGVVNIILKDRYEGAETRARFGTVTDGGARETQLAQSFGTRWPSGGAMIAYEYYHRGALASSSRDYARSADLRPFGGTDHRWYYSLPGNILAFDPATGSFAPAYAIPAGQDGTALEPGDFLAGVTNLENFREGTDLTPSQTRHSVFASASQDIGTSIHLSADARYSRRDFAVRGLGYTTVATVTGNNPYFVSPTGAAFDLIAYSFGPELGGARSTGFSEAMAYTGGIEVDAGGGWQARGYAAYAQNRERSRTGNIVNGRSLLEALGTIPDDPATPFSTAAEGFFNPYGSGGSNSDAILAFVGNGYTLARIRSRVTTFNADADGTLLELPAGQVKLAVGANIRRESYLRSGENLIFTASPVVGTRVDGTRTIKAGFAELRLPIFSDANAIQGVRRLDLSMAVRTEHYGDFGTTTNPKFGVVWLPVDGIRLRSSYGTSFRAPNLRQLRNPASISTLLLPRADGLQSVVLQLSGGNPDLRPEKARSWTIGTDIEPAFLPRLRINATWFRTIFSDRIDRPILSDFSNALINPALAPFVQFVSPATNPADLARINTLLADPALVVSNAYPASAIGAIVDTRYVNTGKTDVSGLDMSLSYGLDAGANHFDLTASGSFLFHYQQKATPASTVVDRLDLAGQPVDFRGRLIGGWSRKSVSATLGLNYVDHYHDLSGRPISSWTTIDLQLGYRPSASNGPLAGVMVALTAQNLFDRPPPFYDYSGGVGYDAANADALGRVVSVQLTKRW